MPSPLTTLGIFHTLVSIVALLVAFYALSRNGRILPKSKAGKLYGALTLIACLTALGIYKHGKFGDAHVLALLTIGVVVAGFAVKTPKATGLRTYVQTILISVSLLFSLIPAVAESLTRLPVGAPLAAGSKDPLVQQSLLALMVIFAAGLGYQLLALRKKAKARK